MFEATRFLNQYLTDIYVKRHWSTSYSMCHRVECTAHADASLKGTLNKFDEDVVPHSDDVDKYHFALCTLHSSLRCTVKFCTKQVQF